MAYVVARARGTYEVRSSASTAQGPRARTLATFRELTDDVLRHAEDRAGAPLDRVAIRRSARRVGAPVAPPPADERAGALLAALARRDMPTPVRAWLVAYALAPDDVEPPEHHLRSAGEWAGADTSVRGEVLRDLLGLVDALPTRVRTEPLRFPRLSSAA